MSKIKKTIINKASYLKDEFDKGIIDFEKAKTKRLEDMKPDIFRAKLEELCSNEIKNAKKELDNAANIDELIQLAN